MVICLECGTDFVKVDTIELCHGCYIKKYTKPDLICKDCENKLSSNDIILEAGKESCPSCGNTGNIWDAITFV